MSTQTEEDPKQATIRQLNKVKDMYNEAIHNHMILNVVVESLSLDYQAGALPALDVADGVRNSIKEAIETHTELIEDIIDEVESEQLSLEKAGSELNDEMVKIANMAVYFHQKLPMLAEFGATMDADELHTVAQNVQLKELIEELSPEFFARANQQTQT